DDRRHLLAGERLDGGPQLLVLGGQGGGSGHRGHSCSSAGSSGAGWSGAADPAPPGGAGAGASAPAGAMVARTASMATASPGRTARWATVPSIGEATECSIFIASTTTIGAPARTSSPTATGTASTVPGIGLRSGPSSAAAEPRIGATDGASENDQAAPALPSHSSPPCAARA